MTEDRGRKTGGIEFGLRPLRAVGSLYEPEAIGAYAYAPVGSGTRRRPIGRDYAAARDAELKIKGKRVRRVEGVRRNHTVEGRNRIDKKWCIRYKDRS